MVLAWGGGAEGATGIQELLNIPQCTGHSLPPQIIQSEDLIVLLLETLA